MKIAAFLILPLLLSRPSLAQDAPKLLRDRIPDQSPQLLILGSVHLHNPGRDAIKQDVDDVLAPARQAQIIALVDQLAAYKPTHITVEHVASDQAGLDELYRSYREGKRELGRSEDEQIGMRLAAKLGLTRVYAADWNGMPPGDMANYRYDEFAKAKGLQAKMNALRDPTKLPFPNVTGMDYVSWYLAANRPEVLLGTHRIYYDVAMLGDAEAQPGANWVGTWYARNLKIFANLVNLTDKRDDRVLSIYGLSHVHPLRTFAQESGAFRLREVSEFVKAPAK